MNLPSTIKSCHLTLICHLPQHDAAVVEIFFLIWLRISYLGERCEIIQHCEPILTEEAQCLVCGVSLQNQFCFGAYLSLEIMATVVLTLQLSPSSWLIRHLASI